MYTHFSLFNIGQIVYLKTDPDQLPRIVTNIKICPGTVLYTLCCGSGDSAHYDIEMSETQDQSIKLGLDKQEV